MKGIKRVFTHFIFMIIVSVKIMMATGIYLAGVSQYLWRGQKLYDKFALQPGVDLNVGSMVMGLWGSFHPDAGILAEADVTLRYALFLSSNAELNFGYTFYTFPQPDYTDSHEVFAGIDLDTFLSPGLSLYYDLDDGDGLYAEASLSYPILILSLDCSLGYNAGQWGYESSLTVLGLGLNASLPAGPVEITPAVFGQIALDDQYKTDGYVSLSIKYNL
ncbi:MAG: hypothetical protein JW827_02595 [Spirochaetes bacterium]|nr:hypothetical protein [Spirochaetota bacterium]